MLACDRSCLLCERIPASSLSAMTAPQTGSPNDPVEKPLQSWKEIAAYLERDVRTARRWEKENGLPVRRHGSGKGASVYAFPSEIAAWRAARPSAVDRPADAPVSARGWAWSAAAAVPLLVAFIWMLRVTGLDPVAEAGAAAGIRTVELCADCDTLGSVSPDGRYLSETDWVGSGDIGIRDLETGEYRRLGDKPSWDDAPIGEAESSLFSPDGQRIAYSWNVQYDGERGYELRVIDAFGDNPAWRTVYRNPEIPSIYPTGWTNDDRLLVWIRRKDWSMGFGFVDIASGDLEIIQSLDRTASGPKLSPDSRWIAYDVPASDGAGSRDIFLLASDGSEAKKLTTHRANDVALGFTPDSKSVLFNSNRTGSYGLWQLPLGSGQPEILMRDLGPVSPLGVLSDGALVYARELGSQDLYQVEIDLDTGKLLAEPRLIDTLYQGSNAGPWVSPDGTRLAYFASPGASLYTRGSPPKLMVHNLGWGDDFEIRTKGLSLYFFWDLDWSPDGRRLAFPATNDRGRWGYYEADVEARTTRKLLDIDSPQPIFWTSGGRDLLFARRETRNGARVDTLMRLEPGQVQPRQVYLSHKGWMRRVAVSPQRDLVAWQEEWKRIQVMPIDGGEPRTVFENTRGRGIQDIAWTPDGSALLLRLTEGDQSEIWIVPLDGSETRKTELAAVGLRQLSPTPTARESSTKRAQATPASSTPKTSYRRPKQRLNRRPPCRASSYAKRS